MRTLPLLMLLLAGCGKSRCVDDDLDGFCVEDDCDDVDASVHPDADEVWYDGVDQDCDGNDDDQDYDGQGLSSDCDDEDPDRYPGNTEIWYDGVDQDCDGNDLDQDGDGVEADLDCDDTDPRRYPGNEETWYDGVDQDCDGNDDDQDLDGTPVGEDCDDEDPERSPDTPEVWYDGVDQDCDGNDDDQDYDGSDVDFDCDDTDPNAYPGNSETWYDGVDGDCDFADDYDADGDGFQSDQHSGDDCDDTDPSINPDAVEILSDPTDQDCDGDVDTAPFQSLALAGAFGLQGPRLAETTDGVVVSILADSIASAPGALYHYLDTDSPWAGSTGAGGWSFSSSYSFGTGFDMAADGDTIVETLVVQTGTYWLPTVIATDLDTGTLTTTSPLALWADFDDLALVYTGSTAGVVACSGAEDVVIYYTGALQDYLDGEPDYAYTVDEGGSACTVREADGTIVFADASSLYRYAYIEGSTELVRSNETSDTILEMAIAQPGTSFAYVEARGSSGLDIQRDSTTVTLFTSGSPLATEVVMEDRDIYAVYVDATGDLWLVYGRVSSGFVEIALDTGLGIVEDADVLVTSGGNLVVVARGNGAVSMMAVGL